MATRIRLKRIGKRHQPSYRIVVVDARRARDSKVLDDLGYYNPLKKDLQLDRNRALTWLLRGAQPTETARWLLSREGVMAELHRLKFERKRKAKAEIEQVQVEEQEPKEEAEAKAPESEAEPEAEPAGEAEEREPGSPSVSS